MFSSVSKIMIVGTSGSGKTTLAKRLAAQFDLTDIELDALFWEPNWTPAAPEVFRVRITNSIENARGFVIHGNYNKVNDLTFAKIDTLIWLDYP